MAGEQGEEAGMRAMVPCVRYAGLAAARFYHPEGECACFRGGPPPVLLPTPALPETAEERTMAPGRENG